MRVAVMIISLCLTMILGLQSCAVYLGSQIIENEKNTGAGAIGLLLAFLFVLGAGFVLALPRLAMAIFVIGGALAFLAATDSIYGDLQIWGGLALALGFMSFLGSRELHRKRLKESARSIQGSYSAFRSPVSRSSDGAGFGASANALLPDGDNRDVTESIGVQARVPCPNCAEEILPNAKVCRFCGHKIGETSAVGRKRSGWWIAAFLLLLTIVIAWLAIATDFIRIETDPVQSREEVQDMGSSEASHLPTEATNQTPPTSAKGSACIAANRDGDAFVDGDGQRWVVIDGLCVPEPKSEDMNAAAQEALGSQPEPVTAPTSDLARLAEQYDNFVQNGGSVQELCDAARRIRDAYARRVGDVDDIVLGLWIGRVHKHCTLGQR